MSRWEKRVMCLRHYLLAACLLVSGVVSVRAETLHWVTSWTGSVQGPYPVGNPSAQPDLRFAFPSAETGARDELFASWSVPVYLGAANATAALQCARDLAHDFRWRFCWPAAFRLGDRAWQQSSSVVRRQSVR